MLTFCELAEEADAFLDGKLSFGERLRIRLHMSISNGCYRLMGQMRAIRGPITAGASGTGMGEDGTTVGTRIDNILDAFQDEIQSGGRNGPRRI